MTDTLKKCSAILSVQHVKDCGGDGQCTNNSKHTYEGQPYCGVHLPKGKGRSNAMPKELVCYYVPGRISRLHAAEELYEKKWLQGQYILKSTVDAEIEAAKYDGYLEGVQVGLDKDDETIKELAEVLDKAMDWWDGTERHPETMQTIRNMMCKALSDNKERIMVAEAQEKT